MEKIYKGFIVKDPKNNTYFHQEGDWLDQITPYVQFYTTVSRARSAIIQRKFKWRNFRGKDESGNPIYWPTWSQCTEEQQKILMADYQILPYTLILKGGHFSSIQVS